MSDDGVMRSDWRMTFRLSRHDLTSVLANYVANYVVSYVVSYEVTHDWRVIDAWEKDEDMSIPDVARTIRETLKMHGESALVFDGSDRTRQWADRQIGRAL